MSDHKDLASFAGQDFHFKYVKKEFVCSGADGLALATQDLNRSITHPMLVDGTKSFLSVFVVVE